jgi:nuclease-like protein
VAKALKSLGPQWTVLHAVPTGSDSSDIDHVAIGPGGIFAISTKDHTGQRVWVGDDSLLVNGHRTNHIANARFDAASAEKLFHSTAENPVKVTPVIAIVDPGSLGFGKKRAKDVVVVRSSHLVRSITHHKRVLSEAEITSYAGMADGHGTLHTEAHILDDTLRHEQRFHRLEHEVASASVRRHCWILFGAFAILAGVLLTSGGALFAPFVS